MLFKSQVFTQASGSVGGLTFARNSSGLYTRARAIPTNPNSTDQQAARNNFGSLATAWRDVVSAAERDAWTEYAANSPVTNRLGDPLTLSGQQMYIRCNSVRLRGSLSRVDPGPVVFGLADLTPPTATALGGTSDLNLAFDNVDNWANEVGGSLLIQVSRQKQPTINYFRGPWRFADEVLGDPTPPTSPQLIANPYGLNYTTGNKIFFRATAVRADGRLTNVAEGSTIIT